MDGKRCLIRKLLLPAIILMFTLGSCDLVWLTDGEYLTGAAGCIFIIHCRSFILVFLEALMDSKMLPCLCSFSRLFQNLKLKSRVTRIWSHWDGNSSKLHTELLFIFENANLY